MCPQGETPAEGKLGSEKPGTTLIVAHKPEQEKSCTGSGLHLPVPLKPPPHIYTTFLPTATRLAESSEKNRCRRLSRLSRLVAPRSRLVAPSGLTL